MAFKTTNRKLIEQYNNPNRKQPEAAEYAPDIKTFSGYVPKGANILDYGCNSGFASSLLKKEGYNVTGVDINPTALKEAEQKYGSEGIRFRLEGYMPLEKEQYDAIFSRNVLADLVRVGGIKKLDKELERLCNATKKGGVIYATTYIEINAEFKMKSKDLTESKLVENIRKYFNIEESKVVEERTGKGYKKRLILVGRKI